MKMPDLREAILRKRTHGVRENFVPAVSPAHKSAAYGTAYSPEKTLAASAAARAIIFYRRRDNDLIMLREDPLGGHIGEFGFRGKTLAYHVEGGGSPVLITHGLSGTVDSYDWRYIFDCLAGTFLVYSFDVTGPSEPAGVRPDTLFEPDRVVRPGGHREKTSVIASPVEAPFVLMAAFQAPAACGSR